MGDAHVISQVVEIANIVAATVACAGTKDAELKRGALVFGVGKRQDTPVAVGVQKIGDRTLHPGQEVVASLSFQAERFNHVPDLKAADNGNVLQADVDIA